MRLVVGFSFSTVRTISRNARLKRQNKGIRHSSEWFYRWVRLRFLSKNLNTDFAIKDSIFRSSTTTTTTTTLRLVSLIVVICIAFCTISYKSWPETGRWNTALCGPVTYLNYTLDYGAPFVSKLFFSVVPFHRLFRYVFYVEILWYEHILCQLYASLCRL